MMLKSNYDNRLAGVGIDVTAGVVNRNIIICKHDCKLKRPNMYQKSLLDEQQFFRFEGQTHVLTCSVTTECSFQECLKSVRSGSRQQKGKPEHTDLRHGVGLSNC